jgi:hypothetical protein
MDYASGLTRVTIGGRAPGSELRRFALALCVAIVVAAGGPAAGDVAYLHAFRAAADAALASGTDQAKAAQLRYGKPDVDGSSNSRPLLVTRWFEYRRAGIRIVFAPAGGSAAAPSVSWVMIGFIDMKSDRQVAFAEGDARLRAARR